MRDASPQQPNGGARLRHFLFRSQQQMGSKPLLAAVCRGGQSLQTGYRKRERAELHDAPRHLNMGHQTAHATEQQAIARRVERIVERELKLSRIVAAKNLREEIPKAT